MILKFDIDDTILVSRFENGKYIFQYSKFEMVEKINRLYDEGNIIIIETGRHWNHFDLTLHQLKNLAGLKFHTLLMGKPVVDIDVDDKNVRPEEFLKLDI